MAIDSFEHKMREQDFIGYILRLISKICAEIQSGIIIVNSLSKKFVVFLLLSM